MGHSIKVSNEVYERLQRLQGPRETYSEVIDRCLTTVEIIKTLPMQRERELQASKVSTREE